MMRHGSQWGLVLVTIGVGLAWSQSAMAQCSPQCTSTNFCTECTLFVPTGQCFESPRNCSDSVHCNGQEICDPDREKCEFACLGGGTCLSGVCSGGSNPGTDCDIAVQPPSCPQGTICNETLDVCTECMTDANCTDPVENRCRTSDGVCVECFNAENHCQDESYCNGEEICNQSTGLCEDGPDRQCDFPKFCSENLVQCVECETDTQCHDGLFCNGVETCNKVSYTCQAGTTVSCKKCVNGSNPGVPCAEGGTECQGGGTCTGGPSICSNSAGKCVECTSNSQCEDLNYCTPNRCIDNRCVFIHNNDLSCGDGQFCNGNEICVNQIGVCNPTTGAGCCFDGPDPVLSDGIACTTDTCNEATDSIVHTPNHSFCSDGLYCTGAETCDPAHPESGNDGCVDGTQIDCSLMNSECRTGVCNDAQQKCITNAANNGVACDDGDHCTAASVCNSSLKRCSNDNERQCTTESQCSGIPLVCSNLELSCSVNGDCPAGGTCGGQGTCSAGACTAVSPTGGFPCVRLEWRGIPSGPVLIGSTVTLDLYAVANGCSGTTLCSSSAQRAISGLGAILGWDPVRLQLKPSTAGDLNPQDPCNSGDSCFTCPANQYNWFQSAFLPDCGSGGDGLNDPCAGTPANDGNSLYNAFSQLSCNEAPFPACATTSGLFVTRFKFVALRGGTTQVSIVPCAGSLTRTSIIAADVRPTGYVTSDVLKSIGPAATIQVACSSHAECDDQNVCTTDTCSCTTQGCGGTCTRTNLTGPCNNGVFCDGANDTCSNGVCVGGGNPCTNPSMPLCDEANDRCVECLNVSQCVDTIQIGQSTVENKCTLDICDANGVCQNPSVDCGDGLACTTDTCEVVIMTPNVFGVCHNTPDDDFCGTGSFCQAIRCDPDADPQTNPSGCAFGNECIGTDGNPCEDPATCNNQTLTCGGCFAPTVAAIGSRYLSITPLSQGGTAVALLVNGHCGDSEVACVSNYVRSICGSGLLAGSPCLTDADCPPACDGGLRAGQACTTNNDCTPLGAGFVCVGKCNAFELTDAPVYRLPSDWGVIKVPGAQIKPSTRYQVHTQCNFPSGPVLSAAAEAKTWRVGDVNGDQLTNVLDPADITSFLKGVPTIAKFEGCNVWDCAVDKFVNVQDLAVVVDRVKGLPDPCPAICP